MGLRLREGIDAVAIADALWEPIVDWEVDCSTGSVIASEAAHRTDDNGDRLRATATAIRLLLDRLLVEIAAR